MLNYPHFNPVAISIGPIHIYWYGLMYLVGFALAWILGNYRARKPNSGFTTEQVGDLIFYCAIGVILGGRLGYVILYNLAFYLQNPLNIFKVWDGGMAFHGGLIGVLIAIGLFAHHTKKKFFEVGDFLVPLIPLGLAAGRIGNFINGELWGRVTTVPWGMIFPTGGPLPRHPSQLYECFLEGIVLFTMLWIYSAKPRPRMAVSGLFLLGYGCARTICEMFRQPDAQLGFIALGWLTRGQELSIPMIICGILFIFFAYRHQQKHVTTQ